MERDGRRLAAILCADVCGYSRLMEADEAGTLNRVTRLRADVLEPAIERFRGRVVGSAGDSLLVEFGSAVDAVTCAAEAQREMSALNDPLPREARIDWRIGINVGDIIAAEGTIWGDGVNVAARVEKIAEPGGICVTQSVLDQVVGKVALSFRDDGVRELKNLSRPVRVYAVLPEFQERASAARPAAPRRKVTVAVLAFDNLSNDAEQEYFSDGITEDVLTELCRYNEIDVVARNSSFAYKGTRTDIREVGRQLGADYVVEGSVRKSGDRVRITAQLIDAGTGAHVWAERYDRRLDDIFAVQDEITRAIVVRVAGRAVAAAAATRRAVETENLTAYDHFLRARELFRDFSIQFDAEPHLERAIDLDPRYAMAHAMLSELHAVRFLYSPEPLHLEKALAHGRTSVESSLRTPGRTTRWVSRCSSSAV